MKLRTRPGRCLYTNPYAGSASRIMYGVRKIVMTETATTIGYRKLPVTPRDTPRVAMMKANSPICVSEKPHCIAVFSGCPDRSTPVVAKSSWPRMTVRVMTTMGSQYWPIIAGSTIMPTDTKKMAPNRSFTGLTRRSMCSASMVSARMEPMMKAPKAAEKPVLSATTTIRKQRPRATMRRVSSFISFRVLRRMRGMRKMPTTSHSTRKNTSLRILTTSSPPSKLADTEMVDSTTINTTARMSSRMRMDITNEANFFFWSPRSSKAL